ncbi:2Fe-2S iron-sulfur cluster-binding protein [Shewanella corallii]|uniref:2Fe-2S iron-sulfur cluster-binding protein n=2 Tax=Shewanella TaxID=22 RepID=A0ABT0NCT8_9GAMM|nr:MULTISPECIES: 2Fe-2S iron-sulfur cluster-binding protein [Shewanella]MCL1039745.1 2Fe-2S iron-sulfur cluster-binding protein [Shewanella submarina]MCL2915631.1 2Fe-2S iron-sulfur cluster-binding protein [Shewanella corallii]
MTLFYLDSHSFHAQPGETVLDTLLRYEYPANYSCKKGRCRSCLLQFIEGDLTMISQRGLEPEQKKAGLVFACQCIPSPKMVLTTPEPNDLYLDTPIIEKQVLTDNIVSVTVGVPEDQKYQAGQCVNLRRPDGVSRTYAIARVSAPGAVELHVRRKVNGDFSQWLYQSARSQDLLQMQGPWGFCHYFPGLPDDTLVLIGSGTGLGAVAGIAEEALSRGHRGEIHLYHSARNLADLYQHKEMLKKMLLHRNFFYQACISAESEKHEVDGKRVRLADPLELAAGRHNYDRSHRVFLCGEPKMVLKGQERAFLGGVPIERIHVLSFDYRELRKHPRTWV